MATVHFHHVSAATNSSLVVEWMPDLHAQLLAAGWTIEYANTDAIGAGSAGTPAWDRTPANSTDAGIAVYRMPENGDLTRWYVRLRPGWAAAVARPHMRGITVGSMHDGNGTVTGPGGEITTSVTTTATNSREYAVAASEDGFLLIKNGGGTSDVIAHAERVRLRSGVQDQVHVLCSYGTEGSAIVQTAGVVSPVRYQFLHPHNSTGGPQNNESLYCPYLDSVIEVGPYTLFGDPLTLPPRLWRIAYPAEFSTGSTFDIDIDGGPKAYRVLDSNITTSFGSFAVATE